ncbi:hypothetical protein CDL15_Pgr015399 [Punica granatum]|uniref:Uncharacterized protein n=1 Tax=Punica granatum TaxID=22663 RepID=A0A218VZH0_PUNGR|nr:hypothetical protein CDL15_Pgr015399 [Punica granatum]
MEQAVGHRRASRGSESHALINGRALSLGLSCLSTATALEGAPSNVNRSTRGCSCAVRPGHVFQESEPSTTYLAYSVTAAFHVSNSGRAYYSYRGQTEEVDSYRKEMVPPQLRVLGGSAAIILGGFVTINVVSAVTMSVVRTVTERKRVNMHSKNFPNSVETSHLAFLMIPQ